jgi:DNA-binding NarL/FixJ family response regulator
MDTQVHVVMHCGNRLLRESIARILSKKTDFHVTTPPSPGSVCLEEMIETEAKILVCDSLVFVQRAVKSVHSSQGSERRFRSVLVAMEDSPEDFLNAVKCGALGYVLKEASAAEVVSAIRAVAKGEAVCPTQYTKVLFDVLASPVADLNLTTTIGQIRLTRREQQLIPLINRGWTNKEIANHLNLSEQTIKTHIHRILHKVGAEGRQSLSGIRYYRGESTPGVAQS